MKHDLCSYLRRHGIVGEDVFGQEAGRHNSLIYGFLGGLFGEPDLQGMPHGKMVRPLWTSFPRVGQETSRIRPGQTVVSELTAGQVVRVLSVMPDVTLPQGDIFFRDADGVFATDHEGEGPWFIPSSTPEGGKSLAEDRSVPISLQPTESLSEAKRLKQERWLIDRLSSRFYVPHYSLPPRGIGEDHLWNYIPTEFDLWRQRKTLASKLVPESSVLAWADGIEGCVVIQRPSLTDCLNQRSAYFLEWPERRWVLAVPEPCSGNLDDTDILPSFVPL